MYVMYIFFCIVECEVMDVYNLSLLNVVWSYSIEVFFIFKLLN